MYDIYNTKQVASIIMDIFMMYYEEYKNPIQQMVKHMHCW